MRTTDGYLRHFCFLDSSGELRVLRNPTFFPDHLERIQENETDLLI